MLSDLFEWKNTCFPDKDYSTFKLHMRWLSPSVCQSLDWEKETFWCDSCFPYKVYFLYIQDTWFALPKYVQINLSLTSSLAWPPQLLSFFEVKQFISRIFNQHRLLGEKRNDTWIHEDKEMQRTSRSLKTVDIYLPKLVYCRTTWFYFVWRRRQHLLVALAQYTVTHFRSSSWFLSSLLLFRRHVCLSN